MPSWWKRSIHENNVPNETLNDTLYNVFRRINKWSYVLFGLSLSAMQFFHLLIVGILVLTFATLTMIECFFAISDIGIRKNMRIIKIPFISGSFILIVLSCLHSGLLIAEGRYTIKISLIMAVLICFLYSLFVSRIAATYNAISDISYTIFSLLYITTPISSAILLAGDLLIARENGFLGISGILWVIYIFLVCKSSDIGRVLGGRTFGSVGVARRFGQEFSVEAIFCGIVVSMAVSIVFWLTIKGSDFLLLPIISGGIVSVMAITGSAVAEVLAQDARIGSASIGFSEMKDIGVLKHVGAFCLVVPICYAVIHLLEMYID